MESLFHQSRLTDLLASVEFLLFKAVEFPVEITYEWAAMQVWLIHKDKCYKTNSHLTGSYFIQSLTLLTLLSTKDSVTIMQEAFLLSYDEKQQLLELWTIMTGKVSRFLNTKKHSFKGFWEFFY